jgi:hypothetical protein
VRGALALISALAMVALLMRFPVVAALIAIAILITHLDTRK